MDITICNTVYSDMIQSLSNILFLNYFILFKKEDQSRLKIIAIYLTFIKKRKKRWLYFYDHSFFFKFPFTLR